MPHRVARVARAEDQVILITEQGGRPVSILRMSRPHAIAFAQKLIPRARERGVAAFDSVATKPLHHNRSCPKTYFFCRLSEI